MTAVRGGPAGPDGLGGSYQNEAETDRSAWWFATGGRQGVLKGFTLAGVGGLMALDVAAGAALVSELDGSGVVQDRGYIVWADATTRVTFGAASASNRNDALVAAFVDTEDGAVGTGALAVGAHLVVIPGVSGTTTARTDAQIRAWLGRGGYVRLADVPIASTDTSINTANIVVPAGLPVLDTGWVSIGGGVVTGTLRYRKYLGVVYVQVSGSATFADGASVTLNPSNAIPADARPSIGIRGYGYFAGYPGTITVGTDGLIIGLQFSGASRASIGGAVTYPLG